MVFSISIAYAFVILSLAFSYLTMVCKTYKYPKQRKIINYSKLILFIITITIIIIIINNFTQL